MARNDPYWLTAKYNSGQCPRCHHQHRRGERIFFYPLTRSAYCEMCGNDQAADFASAVFDERVING